MKKNVYLQPEINYNKKYIMKRNSSAVSLVGIFILMCCVTASYAQCNGSGSSHLYVKGKQNNACKSGFALVIADSNGQHTTPTAALTLPTFKGGNKEMCRYINKEKVYPVNLKNQRISGTATVQAVVKADSTLSDIQVVKSSGLLEFDDEAVRIVKSFPKMRPATQSCENQDMTVQFPVNFNIEEEDARDQKKAEMAETKALQDEIDKVCPVTLYFDNDQPDPGTVKETTGKDYMALYDNYKGKKDVYTQKSGNNAQAKSAIASFFDDEVAGGKDRLTKVTRYIADALSKGKTVSFNISGYASPLSGKDYNKHLSARRIESILNYMKTAEGGVLAPYINGQKSGLSIYKNACGETAAKGDNSAVKGVYGLEAAKDRRIVIDNIVVR